MTPRFLIDRGTATLAVALIARLGDRWRLIDAVAFPVSVDADAAVEYLATRVAGLGSTLPELTGALADHRHRERIEAATAPPKKIALLAPNGRVLTGLGLAAARAGWSIAVGIGGEHVDALSVDRALGTVGIDAIAVAASDPPRSEEREAVGELAALAAAVAGRRPTLTTILSGAAAEHVDLFPIERVVLGRAPRSGARGGGPDDLARLLVALGGQLAGAKLAAGRSAASLAALLERTIELVDVGASGGAWFRAQPLPPDGEVHDGDGDGHAGEEATALWEGGLEGFVSATGALVPDTPSDEDDDQFLDAVIAWSPLRIDRPTHRDRLRDLRARPWHDAAGDGAVLRLAAARAALARLEAQRVSLGGPPAERSDAPDLLILAGGAFALPPGQALALAATDTIRRPGMTQLLYDHARLLAPLGMLGERERLLMLRDLAGDLLLPLGSALVIAGGRPGREVGRLRVGGEDAGESHPLPSGSLRLFEVPPGSVTEVVLELRDGRYGGTRARRVGFQTAGGLAGLLVDTRGVPLRLPGASERRREALGRWQRALWPGAE